MQQSHYSNNENRTNTWYDKLCDKAESIKEDLKNEERIIKHMKKRKEDFIDEYKKLMEKIKDHK